MLRIAFSVFALILNFATPSFAAEYGTRDEAVALVNRVQTMFKTEGAEKTFAAITAKQFNDRDLYPYAYQLNGTSVAHGANPALVGKDLIGLKDPTGKPVIHDIVEIAKSGKPGWIDYKWPNPTNNKIEDKSAYVDTIGEYAIGVGVYR